MIKWVRFDIVENEEGTTITYISDDTPFGIESRKRHIPHANRSGYWDHTTYVVTCRGFDVKTFNSLKDAKEWVEGAKK